VPAGEEVRVKKCKGKLKITATRTGENYLLTEELSLDPSVVVPQELKGDC